MIGSWPRKQVQTEIERIFGEIVDQPTLRELLHECADGRDACANPHQAEIAVSKGPENAAKELATDLSRDGRRSFNWGMISGMFSMDYSLRSASSDRSWLHDGRGSSLPLARPRVAIPQ